MKVFSHRRRIQITKNQLIGFLNEPLERGPPAPSVSVTPWDFYMQMIGKKKSLENHFPVISPQRAWTKRQVNTKWSMIMTWIKTSAIQMSLTLQMQHIPPSTATNCQANKSFTHKLLRLLAACFVFLPPLTTAQFSWQPGLACCFFLERGGEWFFWQHRLP